MKVDIKNVEKRIGGMFRKRTVHGATLTVTFSEEEKGVIEERDLRHYVIVDRSVPIDVDDIAFENRGLVRKLATAAIKGVDANNFNLTINKLMKGPDTYFIGDPLAAKNYIEEIKNSMTQLKYLIDQNTEIAEDESFEL